MEMPRDEDKFTLNHLATVSEAVERRLPGNANAGTEAIDIWWDAHLATKYEIKGTLWMREHTRSN